MAVRAEIFVERQNKNPLRLVTLPHLQLLGAPRKRVVNLGIARKFAAEARVVKSIRKAWEVARRPIVILPNLLRH